MKPRLGIFMGAHRLEFDQSAFYSPNPDRPRSPPEWDATLYRGFQLMVLVAFGAAEITDRAQAWTGGAAAKNLGETSRITVGIAFTSGSAHVYAMPKHYERAGRLRPYSIVPEAKRGFNRLRKSCPFVAFRSHNGIVGT